MTLAYGQTVFLLPPSSLHRRDITPCEHCRAWKRRRLKPPTFRCELNPTPSPFHNLFHDFLSQLPSISSLDLIGTAVGLGSGIAVLLSSKTPKLLPNPKSARNSRSHIGEWILFTSPTPFNRFVTLRCPSIDFPENELMENVSEKLVKEDRHYVKLNSGRMIQPVESSDGGEVEKLVYQRLCISTEDGGVLSLDWPSNLALEEERGFDTTVLIVPGTAAGSSEKKIRAFVCDCLRRGVFPIIMNPRGCAASPLTTPRLFTAADSDDISIAIQYITKKRPWTTLMAVSWEYGANMLTKYLAEFGERTPLMAAVCIDNPFDLEEATRSSIYHPDFDQRQTDGLIKILQCNKELFQGRGKGFNVERALAASSVRDFERAISMVSYGYDTIEDFYAKSSTRDVIDKVKVPVLFIQNDDGKVPFFSIPRSSIAENPYTSLLLCSYKQSRKILNDKLTFSWCQHLALEWLAAVELGLLKGRHPLLKDVDVTINPSKGLALLEGRASPKRGRVDELLNLTNGSAKNPQSQMLQIKDTAIRTQLGSKVNVEELHVELSHGEDNNVEKQSVAAVDPTQEGDNASDTDRGQVLQTAEVVMNMLDVTVPETLTDEQKKKVLNAVGRGETLIKALQDAVPEDVRGKLTTAVSGIMQSRGSDLKFDKLLQLGSSIKEAPGHTSKVLHKDRPSEAVHDKDVQSLDQKKKSNGLEDGNSGVDHGPDMPSGDMESEKQASKILQKQSDPSPDLGKGSNNEIGNSGDNTVEVSDREIVAEVNTKQDSSTLGAPDKVEDIPTQTKVDAGTGKGQSDPPDKVEDIPTQTKVDAGTGKGQSDPPDKVEDIPTQTKVDAGTGKGQSDPPDKVEDIPTQTKVDAGTGKGQSDLTNENSQLKNDISNEQSKLSESGSTEENSSAPSPTSEAQVMENEAENSQGKVEKDPMSVLGQTMSDSPGFSVSQAFNALTGFDDSTQVAVTNVFNVIEGMIDQLEEKRDDVVDEVENKKSIGEVNGVEKVKDFSENSVDISRSQVETEGEISSTPISKELPTKNVVKYLNSSSEMIPTSTNFPYGDPIYKECLKTYLSLKMKNAKPLGTPKPSAYLDYIPEEGQWKLLEQTENDTDLFDEYATSGSPREGNIDSQPRSKNSDNTIEPSYMIVDSGKSEDPFEELEKGIVSQNAEFDETKSDGSAPFVKSLILECLEIEVGRRVHATDVDDLELNLATEMEYVADAVSMVAGNGKHYRDKWDNDLPGKLGILDGEDVVRAISSAVQHTEYLRTVLPIGVIVGSILAALRKFFDVAALNDDDEQDLALDHVDKPAERLLVVDEKESSQGSSRERQNKDNFMDSSNGEDDGMDLGNSEVLMGAVTAALGASALFVHQQSTETSESLNEPLNGKENGRGSFKPDEMPERTRNSIVTSLAEKAMSIASPVVPMKEGGGVDHERLVSVLADLGQKGGILRLIGKVALLWGGIRGAMSLIEKLITFLRIAERPLLQRIPGFVFMVLLLWSPVVLPLLPSLMQSWATNYPFRIAEYACIAGLYVSTMVMITVWGKRVREYEDPLVQYGFDMASLPKLQNFLKGLAGGAVIVTLIHTVNSLLGCGNLHWPNTLSLVSSNPVALMGAYGQMLLLIIKGTTAATTIAVVEELLFRSWLPQEIAVDYGYHRGVLISGLLFALSQRTILEIPGLWLLSISLSGARQRSQGSLSLPIGLRAGILAANFFFKSGGFLTYQPTFPLWLTGVRPFRPFSGVVGLAFSSALVVIFFSQQLLRKEKRNRVIGG